MKLRLAMFLILLVVLAGLFLALWSSQPANRGSLFQPASELAEAASAQRLRDAGVAPESIAPEDVAPEQHREQVEHHAVSTHDPREAPLGPPASLSVLVAAAEGPAGYARVTLRSPRGRVRSVMCDAHGRCSFDELESGVAWAVEVTDPAFLKTQRFDPLTLEAGESRRVGWALWCSGIPLRGYIVDDLGGRIAGHEVRVAWRRQLPDEALERRRQEMLDQADYISTHTDASGYFEFEVVAPGGWWIWPVAGREPPEGEYLSVGTGIIHGSEENSPAHMIVLHRGLALSGKVLGPDGSPAPRVLMAAKGSGGLMWRRTALSNEQGEFEIVGLPEGEYSLSAWGQDDDWDSLSEPDLRKVAVTFQWGAVGPSELRVLAGTRGHVVVWHGAPEQAESGAWDGLLEDWRSR